MADETNVSSSLINTSVDFVEINLDGVCVDTVKFSVAFLTRKLEIYWNFDPDLGKHSIEMKLINPDNNNIVMLNDAILYTGN